MLENMKMGVLSALLGFTLVLGISGTIASCSNNSGGGGGGSGYNIPAPGVGQWVAFGGHEPTINGTSWAMPVCSGSTTGCSTIAGYFYTQLATPPKVGQTLTLNFTVTGNNPVWQQQPASGGNSETDINPPTIHLFLWRRGDNLSCVSTTSQNSQPYNGGYADYRLFAGRTPLVLGANQTVSVPLDAAHWTNCWGAPPLAMSDELNNLIGVGVTFGGQWFAGHGIYLSGGNATFTVNSFTVQ